MGPLFVGFDYVAGLIQEDPEAACTLDFEFREDQPEDQNQPKIEVRSTIRCHTLSV